MKALRVLMLVLALSVCAYADGNMPNGIAGDMDCGVAEVTDSGTSITTAPTITETVFSLLQSVLSVF